MKAWAYLRPKAKAVGLFDKDEDAQRTRAEVNRILNTQAKNETVHGVTLIPGKELRQCYEQDISIPYAIEEVLPREIWDYAESEKWLQDRKGLISLYGFKRTTVTFKDYMRDKLPDKHHRRLALKKVRLTKKQEFSEYICSLEKGARRTALASLVPTLKECFAQLGIEEGAE